MRLLYQILYLFVKSLCIYVITELECERYKFVVQAVIGEQRGEGVK